MEKCVPYVLFIYRTSVTRKPAPADIKAGCSIIIIVIIIQYSVHIGPVVYYIICIHNAPLLAGAISIYSQGWHVVYAIDCARFWFLEPSAGVGVVVLSNSGFGGVGKKTQVINYYNKVYTHITLYGMIILFETSNDHSHLYYTIILKLWHFKNNDGEYVIDGNCRQTCIVYPFYWICRLLYMMEYDVVTVIDLRQIIITLSEMVNLSDTASQIKIVGRILFSALYI